MAKSSSSRKRLKPKDTKRRGKKKISPLPSDAVEYLDYKDVDLLKRFLSDRAKIRPRRVSGNDTQQQRVVSRAIKNAREMGLLPYTSRVTTQRRGRAERSERPDREERSERFEEAADEMSEGAPAPVDGAPAGAGVADGAVEAAVGGEI